MSDQFENAPEMPEPQPVFDVTYSHIYTGQVYNQFYFFLWVSVAFFIGAVLPWNGVFGNEGYTIWQLIMMVCSVGAIWSSIASIKGRRLTLWPILSIEILAIVFLLVHFKDVKATSVELRLHHKVAIQQEMDSMPELPAGAAAKYKQLLMDRMAAVSDPEKIFPLTAGNVLGAPFSGMLLASDTDNKPGADPTRFMATTAWNSFGSGFHMTWIATLSLTFFMLISFFTAFKNAKPKEDPKEARRLAREARAAGASSDKKDDDDKEIVGEQDDTKV